MLNFKLELETPLFMNARAMRHTMMLCAGARMPWSQCLKMLEGMFPEMTHDQFMEVRYEVHELGCVKREVERQSFWDYSHNSARYIRRLLELRSEPDFSHAKKYIQMLGRGLRIPQDASDLIGKEVRIQIKRDKNEE